MYKSPSRNIYYFLTLVFLVTNSIKLSSQTLTQIVKGKVFDKESNSLLPGASVVIVGSEPLIGTITDDFGNFKLTVPVGRSSISVSYIGYEDIVLSNISVIAGKETVLEVPMRERFYISDEVKVVAKKRKNIAINNMAAISARVLSPDDAARYAGGFFDPSRMVSAFAGVSTVEGDGVNDIVIRGNSPRGLLWRLEGIEIPNPNHFTDGQGSTGGSIGIITSNVLAMSDFFSGAFPAEYGNAYSGVMDIGLRSGNTDKYEFAIQTGVVGLEATAEGPVLNINGSSFLINYRYSTLGILGQVGLIELGNNNIPPVFQDLTFNLKIPTRKAGIFNLFGVGGMSNTGTKPTGDSLVWTSFDDRESETEYHKMGVIALKHIITLTDSKTFFKTIVAAEGQQDRWNMGYLINDYSEFETYKDNYSYPSLRFAFQANHKLNRLTTLRGGFNYSLVGYDMFARKYKYDQMLYDTIIDRTGTTSLYQFYGQINRRLTKYLEVGIGLHFMHFALNNQSSVEPRASVKWYISEKHSLSFGAGIHTRTESVVAYLAPVTDSNGYKYEANKNLDFTRAFHYVLGYDYLFSTDLRIKSELYYQHLTHVPLDTRPGSMLSTLNVSYGVPDIPFENKGKGYNCGIEFTIEKFYSDNYYFLSTISLFDSKYQTIDGEWYNTYFNSNYVFNLLGGKDFLIGKTKQNILGLNTKILYRGGFRHTPVDKEATAASGQVVFNNERYNEERYPDFIRFDIGFNYRRNNKGYSWIISADIQNVLNRQNTLGYEYSIDGETSVVGQGLIPIINFRIEF